MVDSKIQPAGQPSGIPAAQPKSGRRGGVGWIPIRTLAARHRPRILAHLLSLGERDRYLRFGHMASDPQIKQYVDRIDFDRDEVFGVFNRRLALVAMAHLSYFANGPQGVPAGEFGVTVAPHLRGRGFGERLFDHAALHARNHHIDTLLVNALSENTAMLRIARNAGARIERDGPESQAWVRLAPESLASHVEALVEERAADVDYGLKRQAQRMDGMLSGLTTKT